MAPKQTSSARQSHEPASRHQSATSVQYHNKKMQNPIRKTSIKYYLIPLLVIALPSLISNVATQSVQHPLRPTPKSLPVIPASADLPTFEEPPLQPKSNERSQQQTIQKPAQSHLINEASQNATGSRLLTSTSLSNVRTQWRHMDHSLGDSISSYAKYLRKVLVDETLLASNVSKRCRSALTELVESLDERHLWASQMVDASARLPAGLLEGTLTELGNFDQCLSIVGRTLQQPTQPTDSLSAPKDHRLVYGQYCSIVVRPTMIQRPRLHTVCRKLPALSANTSSGVMKMLSLNSHQFYYVGLRLGICVPSKCAQTDLQQLLATYLLKYDLIGQVKSCQNRVPTVKATTSDTAGAFSWLDSVWSESQMNGTNTLDTTQKCIILTFAVLLSLTLIGTIVDLSSSTAPSASRKQLAGTRSLVCKQCRGAIVSASMDTFIETSGLRRQAESDLPGRNNSQQKQHQLNGKAHPNEPTRDHQWLHPLAGYSQQLSHVFCASCLASQQVSCSTDDASALLKAAANGRRYWHYQVCPSSVASTTPAAIGVRTEPNGCNGNVIQYNETESSADMCLNAHRMSSLNSHCLLDSTGNDATSATNPNNGQKPLIGPQINPLAQLAASGSTCNYSSDDSSSKNWFTSDFDRYEKCADLDPPPDKSKAQRRRGNGRAEPEATGSTYLSQSVAPNELDSEGKAQSCLRAFMLCFSLRVNLRVICKLGDSSSKNTADSSTTTSALNGDIKCIHGLRTLAMVWIIFGHTIGLVSPEMLNNLFPLARLSCQSRLLQALLNATLAVDTFFMISGLVTAISFARKCKSVLNLVSGNNINKQQQQVDKQQGFNSNLMQCSNAPAAKSTPMATTTEATDSMSLSSTSSVSATTSSWESSTSQSASSSLPFDIGRTRTKPPVARARPLSRVPPLHWMQIAASSRPKSHLKQPIMSRESSNSDTTTNTAHISDSFRPVLWICMRYLRLTPAYATIIGATILLPALGSGPFWTETIEPLANQCRSNWWLNLVYLNNFYETDKLCLIHSWYLSNDCQMFVMATILLAVLYRSKRVALLLALVICFGSSAMTFAVTVANELPPTIVTTSPAIAERWLFIYSLYYKPWPHLTSYIIGLLTGYLILMRGARLQAPKTGIKVETGNWKRTCCWLMMSALALALLNSIYPWNMGFQVDPLITGLHSATFRSLWALCNAWVVWAIVSSELPGSVGKKSSLGSILSWTGFQMSSRLTYCAYLVHPLIIYYHFGTLRERMDSSIYSQTHRFLATLLMSYLAALLLSLFVESPVIQLQRLLTQQPRTKLSGKSDQQDKKETLCDQAQVQQQQQQHRRHRRQWPIRLSAEKPLVSMSAMDLSSGPKIEADSSSSKPRVSMRKISSSSSSSNGTTSNELKPLTSVHFCPHLMAAGAPVPIAPMLLRSPVAQNKPQINGTDLTKTSSELGADRSQSGGSNHSAVDEQFQRKLAQAIGRGFKIRSKIAAANYTNNGRSQLRKSAATSREQMRAPNECDLHLYHRCPAAEQVVVSSGEPAVNQCPTRPNRAELSTFLAHCNPPRLTDVSVNESKSVVE